MNAILVSTDLRLLTAISKGGIASLGVYHILLAEMQRRGTATLNWAQWTRILQLVLSIDATEEVEINHAYYVVEDLVGSGLLKVAGDVPVLRGQGIYSPEMAEVIEQQARASERARKAAAARWKVNSDVIRVKAEEGIVVRDRSDDGCAH